MGQAIAVRTDYTAGEVRRCAKRAKDAAQARPKPKKRKAAAQAGFVFDEGKGAVHPRAAIRPHFDHQ
jgi:hypothetical protein